MGILFGKLNFDMIRGTEWNDDFTLVDQATGVAVSLAGITDIIMRVRAEIGSPILMELRKTTGELVVVDAGTGAVGIRISGLRSRTDFPENGHEKAKYLYDAIIERASGAYEAANTGKVTVRPQITRPWGAT